MRLGEILIAAGLLSEQQVLEARNRQASVRGRLGTQLVQLGFISTDQVSLALGKQHQVPPVLVRHFAHNDPAVLPLIGAKVAAEYFIVPIAYARKDGQRRLVVCLRDPRNTELISRLQQQLRVPVVASVASELAIRVYLERYYHVDAVAKQGSFAATDDDEDVDLSDFGDPDSGLDTLELIDLDDRKLSTTAPARFVPEAQRTSGISEALRAAAQAAAAQAASAQAASSHATASHTAPVPLAESKTEAAASSGHSSGHSSGPRAGHSSGHSSGPAPTLTATASVPAPAPISTPLEAFVASIAQADKRPAVSEAIMEFLRQRFAAGLMFTIKDGLAMGHLGFGGHLDDPDTVAALMIPMSKSVFGVVHDTRESWRGDPKTHSSAAQERFLTLFAMDKAPAEIVVAPIVIGSKVVCLLYAHARAGAAIGDTQLAELAAITEATNDAFARIIRNARKSAG